MFVYKIENMRDVFVEDGNNLLSFGLLEDVRNETWINILIRHRKTDHVMLAGGVEFLVNKYWLLQSE
jgi:hypothetical protein